ncbi:MAG TPA: sugar ABC transporter substrate-binding protein [Phototrophicaceae bacterium]|nr:sugar ABC transporter substrate-binding protein [Phototrophicaceae bacterium]
MFKYKRLSILMLVVAVFAVLSLPAQAQEATPAATAAEASGVTIPAVKCAQPGDLTLRVWDENWAKTLKASTAAWIQEYCPGATVTVDQVPWGQYWDQLKTDASSGDLPDIFNLSQDQFGYYASNDALLDLSPYFAKGGVDPTVWGSGEVDPYRYGDNKDVYSAPLNWDSIAIFYNKDMFDKAGLAYPTADWTWDDFAKDAAALTDSANGVWGASVYNDYQSGWANWIASAGVAPVATAGRTQCTLTDPASQAALTFLQGLVQKGYMPTISQIGGTNADDEYNLFKSGKLAMYSNGEWQLPNAVKDITFNWDLVTLPKNPTTGESRSIVHAVGYSVAATSKNPDLAANLVQFLVSDEGEKFFADAGGVPPADPNPALLAEWKNSFGSTKVNIQAFIDALNNSQGVTTFGEAGDPTTDMITEIFDNNGSVADATAKACAAIGPYLNPPATPEASS